MSCVNEDDGKDDIEAVRDLVFEKAELPGGRAKVKAAFAKYGAERLRDMRISDLGPLSRDLFEIVAPAAPPEYVKLSTIPFGAIVECYKNKVLYFVSNTSNGTGHRALVTLAGNIKDWSIQDELVKLISLRIPEGALQEPKFKVGDDVLLYGKQYRVRGIDEPTYRLSNGGSYLARKLTKVETKPCPECPPEPAPLTAAASFYEIGDAINTAKAAIQPQMFGFRFDADGAALMSALAVKGLHITYRTG